VFWIQIGQRIRIRIGILDIGRPKIVPKEGKMKKYMFEEFSIGLEAPSGIWMSFAGIEETGLDPDSPQP
jgi:hypothetical protein